MAAIGALLQGLDDPTARLIVLTQLQDLHLAQQQAVAAGESDLVFALEVQRNECLSLLPVHLAEEVEAAGADRTVLETNDVDGSTEAAAEDPVIVVNDTTAPKQVVGVVAHEVPLDADIEGAATDRIDAANAFAYGVLLENHAAEELATREPTAPRPPADNPIIEHRVAEAIAADNTTNGDKNPKDPEDVGTEVDDDATADTLFEDDVFEDAVAETDLGDTTDSNPSSVTAANTRVAATTLAHEETQTGSTTIDPVGGNVIQEYDEIVKTIKEEIAKKSQKAIHSPNAKPPTKTCRTPTSGKQHAATTTAKTASKATSAEPPKTILVILRTATRLCHSPTCTSIYLQTW